MFCGSLSSGDFANLATDCNKVPIHSSYSQAIADIS
jgi:hypothetical protein